MTLDEGKEIFESLRNEWSEILETIDNEADTRFKIIDKILGDVLGWHSLGDFNLEQYGDSGYADYILSADGRDRLVVEAKRINAVLVGTRANTTQYLTVKSSALVNAQAGLKQAQAYCVDTGTTFAALTSGIEWIAYWAVREAGKKPSEGKVIVFPSLEAISEDFALFWDLFSRQAVIEERYKVIIREAEGLHVQSSESLRPVIKSNELKFIPKSQLAKDLDRVFKEFFSSMAGQSDPEMLANCFVESKESREADVNLEKIASSLINKLELMSSDEGEQLQRRIQDAIDSKRGEFVLIIGNKGAGKTTFIDRFFRLVLPSRLRDSCVVIRVDVGKAAGDPELIVQWLNRNLLTIVEQELFENGIATNEQLQGIFYAEYCRWREGPHKTLYETNKDAFKIKFGEYIEDLRKNQVDLYIERLLKDIVDNRKKMPCLVFDNTDHFNEKFQDAVFQYAQSIFKSAFSFVICPITDRTIWELSKHGPMQSYDTTSFYLPVPAMKSVLEKRIDFIRKKLQDVRPGERGEYFLGRGIRLNIQDISAFTTCLEEIFITNEGMSRIVGSLANFDIRRSLQLSQQIVTSPHIKIDELVKFYLSNGRIRIKPRPVSMSILCGDTNHYSKDASHYIVNLFEVQGDDLTSPLLKLSILRFFMDIESQAGQDVQASHASVEDATGYFSSMGVSQSTVKAQLQRLSRAQLLASYDAAEQQITEDSRLRITPSGKIHFEWALSNPVYLTEAAITTSIRSCHEKDELLTIWSASGKMEREDWERFMQIFASYCLGQDAIFITVPTLDAYASQRAIRNHFRTRWVSAAEAEHTTDL